jgi:Apea-like HEPN
MRKGSKPAADSGGSRSDVVLGMGLRGKYVERYRASQPQESAAAVGIDVWAPLIGFESRAEEFPLAADTRVRAGSAYRGYESQNFANFLSLEEKEECRTTRHWLHIRQPVHHDLSPGANVNACLLALWIVRPTRTYAPVRFQETAAEKTVVRLLDRFQWVEGRVAENVQLEHLEQLAGILPPLRKAYVARRRLRHAFILTFRGCVSPEWQSAYVCFAAAAETLLTSSRKSGLTARLAKAYATLAADGPDRGAAEERFRRLYEVRSDIVHGRAYERSDSTENLDRLADFSDVLRHLWRRILESKEHQTALEADDVARDAYLSRLR